MKNRKKMTGRKLAANILIWAVLILLALLVLVPFVYMLLLSLLKDNSSLRLSFEKLANSTWTMENYTKVLRVNNFSRYILNSCIASFYAVAVACTVGAMAGYAFAKKKFPGSTKMYMVYLITMMIPSQVSLIPTYIICKNLGLLNTYTVLAVPAVSAFGTILMHSFIKAVPDELLDSAQMDGCSEFGKFTKIVVPLIRPALLSLAIFTFIEVWSMLLWPLLTTSSNDMMTVTMAVTLLKSNKAVTNYGFIMAGTTLAFLPPFILYLILQRQFVEGIALSGIKS